MKEVIKELGTEHTLRISNLWVNTQYSIMVQAFNRMGQGPMSEEVIESTAQSAGQGAPIDPNSKILLMAYDL